MTHLKALFQATSLDKIDARVLLAHLIYRHFKWPKSYLISHDLEPLTTRFTQDWLDLEARRKLGEPVAYLTQTKGFHAIELMVGPNVLIPRPETEMLVELGLAACLKRLNDPSSLYSVANPLRILDLGCGSGAIILALAYALNQIPKHSHHIAYYASDVSRDAILIAQQNARGLEMESLIQFFLSDWFDQLPNYKMDIILSNPPYLSKDDPHLSMGDLRFEPKSALTDFSDGLSAYRSILLKAPARLAPDGLLFFEHGFTQGTDIFQFFADVPGGLFKQITTEQDYSGHDRITWGQKG